MCYAFVWFAIVWFLYLLISCLVIKKRVTFVYVASCACVAHSVDFDHFASFVYLAWFPYRAQSTYIVDSVFSSLIPLIPMALLV